MMKSKSFKIDNLRFYLLLVFVFGFTICSAQKNQPPNVILILTDDQGYGDIAVHGNKWIQTPNLDKLHHESTRFTNFHSGTTCSPTRAALLTGRNNNRTGVWHTITGRNVLRENEISMARIFSDNGYETGMFGKWHLGVSYPARPIDKGFKKAVYYNGGGIGNAPDYWGNDYFDDRYIVGDTYRQFQGYCTDVWFSEAIKFIRENKGKPFFCYLATNAPHGPHHIGNKYSDRYKNNENIPNPNFYGMITNVDENIGKLREELQRLGIDKNTILIFTTDNGTAAGIKLEGHWRDGLPTPVGYNAGMRGLKGSPFEGGHRVPCFMYWPAGGLNKAKDIHELAAHFDILPTLKEICRLKTPASWKPDGISLLDAMKGNTTGLAGRTIIVDNQRKLKPDKWRLSSVMYQNYRLINGEELYDLSADPGQQQNISNNNPQMVRQLREKYEAWYDDVFRGWEVPSYTVLDNKFRGELLFTSHDWMDPVGTDGKPLVADDEESRTVFNQVQVRSGILINGFWYVDVRAKGRYRFELRRWPKEANASISAGMPPSTDSVPGGKPYGPGVALSVTKATIEIAGITLSKNVEVSDKLVDFEIQLPAGKTKLKTSFTDGKDINAGAYYVYVSKIE